MLQLLFRGAWRKCWTACGMNAAFPTWTTSSVMANPLMTVEHQGILCQLINTLNNPPVLACPDFDLLFVVHIDASEQGLGAVLYQHQNRRLRVIAYGSRTLSPAEKNYRFHSGKLEFLALKWAVCEKFRDYLFSAPNFTRLHRP